MIYKVFLIDVLNGISLLEVNFKEFQKKDKDIIFSKFFKKIDPIIDDIKIEMSKSSKAKEFTTIYDSNDSSFLIYYQPLTRILFCSISDADDDIDKIKESIQRISHRFIKKHQSNLKIFRDTTEKTRFQTFTADIENLTLGGRIAEVFPKLLIAESALKKILANKIISELDFEVALLCDGKNSPLRILKKYPDKSKTEISEILKKLEQLDIIRM